MIPDTHLSKLAYIQTRLKRWTYIENQIAIRKVVFGGEDVRNPYIFIHALAQSEVTIYKTMLFLYDRDGDIKHLERMWKSSPWPGTRQLFKQIKERNEKYLK